LLPEAKAGSGKRPTLLRGLRCLNIGGPYLSIGGSVQFSSVEYCPTAIEFLGSMARRVRTPRKEGSISLVGRMEAAILSTRIRRATGSQLDNNKPRREGRGGRHLIDEGRSCSYSCS
jgi:hypothetical protein